MLHFFPSWDPYCAVKEQIVKITCAWTRNTLLIVLEMIEMDCWTELPETCRTIIFWLIGNSINIFTQKITSLRKKLECSTKSSDRDAINRKRLVYFVKNVQILREHVFFGELASKIIQQRRLYGVIFMEILFSSSVFSWNFGKCHWSVRPLQSRNEKSGQLSSLCVGISRFDISVCHVATLFGELHHFCLKLHTSIRLDNFFTLDIIYNFLGGTFPAETKLYSPQLLTHADL